MQRITGFLVGGPARRCGDRVVFRTNTHASVSTSRRRAATRALLLGGAVLGRLLRALTRLGRALVMKMMMTVIMKMIGPILRAGPADTERRESYGHHVVRDSRLEKAFSRLARIVPHLGLVARFL